MSTTDTSFTQRTIEFPADIRLDGVTVVESESGGLVFGVDAIRHTKVGADVDLALSIRDHDADLEIGGFVSLDRGAGTVVLGVLTGDGGWEVVEVRARSVRGVHHVDAVVGRPVRQGAAKRSGLHLLGRALGVGARLRAVHDATAGELGGAHRALTRTSGALLAVRLASTAGDLAAGLGLGRALAQPRARIETQGELVRVRQAMRECGRDAVGGNDVKSHAGAQDGTGLPRFGAKVLGYQFNMVAIPDDLNIGKDPLAFDPAQMRMAFDAGRAMAMQQQPDGISRAAS